jgi:hypothetical protein
MISQLNRRAVTGAITFLPGGPRLDRAFMRLAENPPLYSYSVWLRHVVAARDAGLPTTFETVVEIGPGRSLGTGLCALLCGAANFFAWDLVKYTDLSTNATTLDRLVALLGERHPLDEGEPSHHLVDPAFPGDLLSEARLEELLASDRVAAIRQALLDPGSEHEGFCVEYTTDPSTMDRRPDLILSQAVMEHVTDLELEYGRMAAATAPGAVVSHEIDFTSHNLARDWNGQWTFSDPEWRLVTGRRDWAINRAPLQEHLDALAAAGFDVRNVLRRPLASRLSVSDLQPRFRSMPAEDLTTASALVQAIRT